MSKSQKISVFICSVFFMAGLFFNKGMAQQPDSISAVDITYAVGADLSFLKSAEDRGVEFKVDGKVKPGLDIFRDHGYDIIGLSYYPWWHGNLLQLRENLLSLVENYDRDIILVEAGYRPHEYENYPAPYPGDIPGGPRKAIRW